MLVVVAAFVANAESQKPRRLTQAPLQLKKFSRSPLHRAAAFPLQQLGTLSELSALKMFLEALDQDAFVQ